MNKHRCAIAFPQTHPRTQSTPYLRQITAPEELFTRGGSDAETVTCYKYSLME